jgi:hypothetical protein
LASPPVTSGQRTLAMLGHALFATGCTELEVVNLCAKRAPDLPALTALARGRSSWTGARHDLKDGLRAADEVLLAWGLDPLAGTARQHRSNQIRWVAREAASVGLIRPWVLGGEPRHPSRWHQYVSDKYGRTIGGNTRQRLQYLLAPVDWADVLEPKAKKIQSPTA